jgi:PAS domain S-box-containing protein
MMVRFLLANRFPLLLWWGPDFCQLYNDAYRPVLGAKHPQSLGQPVSECWSEIWHILEPLIRTPFEGGPATWMDDIPLEINRYGFTEETHFTIAYSPLPDETAPRGIGGVLATVHEISEKVVGERRTMALRDLGVSVLEERTAEDACARAAGVLAKYPKDVAFALLYLLDPERKVARLAGTAGLDDASRHIAPVMINISAQNVQWPLLNVMGTGGLEIVENLGERFGTIPQGAWSDPPNRAAVVPIRSNVAHQLAGFLIAGISPRLKFDELYRSFLELAASQIATAVTNARAYEEERRRAEALAELDHAKTLFFSNVSHEFRTPLTLMLGPLEEVLEKSSTRLDSEEYKQLEVTRRNALRLLKLVNTLLDFSRIEAGRVQAIYEPTDLARLTSDIASVFRSAMAKAGLQYSVECEPIDQPVYVDRDMWEKIVLNLLSNAFKFTFEGEIAVALKSVNNSVELSVRDTGVGISEEEQAKVFERFHRIESTRARTYEGTGIGLALVQELVKLHGGTVRLKSSLGAGSTFTVSIPHGTTHLPADRIGTGRTLTSTAVSAEAYVDEALRWLPKQSGAVAEETTKPTAAPAAAPRTFSPEEHRDVILVADDNADMRDYLAHLLRDDYAVYTAVDGAEAVTAARQLRPALVLTDVMMPTLDGFGVLQAIRNDESLRDTPVILLSARAGEESRVEGLQAGADDYLVKPFTARELIARVKTQVNMTKLRHEAAEREARLRGEAEREQHRLQELLSHAPAAIGLTSGPEHRWVYVNEEYIRLTGRNSAADFLGKPLIESLPEVETQVFVDLLNDVYRTGKPFFGREMKAILNRSAKGLPEECYWDFVYQPFCDGDGKVEGILVHAIEVTDKVIARNTVAENAERLRLAQTAAQIGTWEWDPVRDFRSLSPELHRLFGTEADDPDHANKWAERVYRADWSKVERCMGEGHRSGEMDFEYRYSHPQLGLRWFYCKGRRFRNETRMFGIVQDITERKEAEEALRESEERYRTVAETAHDAILSIDESSTIQFANSATARVFGYKPAEIVGKNLTMLMPEYMRHLHEAGLKRYVATGKRHLSWDAAQLPGRHRDGREIPLEVSFGEYTKGGKQYFTGFARDITERKQAEQALRESEQKLRVITDATPVMIWLSGTDKLCYYLNKSWLDFVGRTMEEEIGNGWAENVHPDDFDRCLQIYASSFDARQPFEMEYRLRHHSGQYRWILDHGVPRFTADGTFEGYVGGCLDIHEQKEAIDKVRIASDALRESEQRFRALVNASSYVVYRVSADWSEMRQLDGRGFISNTEEPTQNWIDVYIHPDDQPLVLKTVRHAIETKSIFELEHRVRRVDGTLGWTLSRAVPLLDRDGNIVEWFGAASDVTARKNAEEARRRLAAIVESSEDAIISKDLNGIITSWNPQAERLFGYKEEEMVGRSVLTIIPPELHHDEDMILSKIRNGQGIDHFETVRIAKSGERLEVSLSISPVRDGQGYIIGAAKIVRDIREAKKIERALRTTEKLAAAGRLAATVAHEINNPLEAVNNLVFLAKRDVRDPGKVSEYLRLADRELERVAHIARQTLGFYRDTSAPSRFGVVKTIDDLLFLYEKRFETRNIRVIKQYKDVPEITALAGEIRQALSNLISNAIDAMPSGGCLAIRVSQTRKWKNSLQPGVRITILDTGTGIQANARKSVFEPFFTTKADVGTGLGLWITKNIIEKHHGNIRFLSKTGPRDHGTAFSMFLPFNIQDDGAQVRQAGISRRTMASAEGT